LSIASLVSLAHKVQSTYSRLVEDIRGFYDWMTQAEGLLFPKPPLDFIGIIRGAEAFPILGRETWRWARTHRLAKLHATRSGRFILKKIAFEY
jgi:hypothetical protein